MRRERGAAAESSAATWADLRAGEAAGRFVGEGEAGDRRDPHMGAWRAELRARARERAASQHRERVLRGRAWADARRAAGEAGRGGT
jgi:hypothetical protein